MIRKTLKKFLPASVKRWRERRIATGRQQSFSSKSTSETFSEIYAANLWGGKPGEFCSGEGSSEAFAVQYGGMIGKFIAGNKIKTVVDLGCGDFNVAKEFVSEQIDYTGVDVVEPLIELNRRLFGSGNVRFVCLDISEDELPDGELCLVRQVLQHLSNAEIAAILDKCKKYPFLIVTEHYPAPGREIIPNLDIPHGPGIRVYYDSAVFLDKPPFVVKNMSLLMEVEGADGTLLKSFLVDNRCS